MMKHRHHGGRGRHHPSHHHFCEMRGFGPAEGGHHGRGRRRGGRLFDYGELRLLVLALISEQPAHGYELIKTIEERFGGGYSPSPGVIYPTLSWLEDSGYATVEAQAGRKNYAITAEGAAFLSANRAAADALIARSGGEERGPRHGHVQIRSAMENLKTALRLQMREGIDEATVEQIAAAIDAAAIAVGKAGDTESKGDAQ